jgi:serine/threonine protein kinase
MNNPCPSRNDLESYFNGSLSADNLELISQHILECEKCVAIIESIEGTAPKPQIPNLASPNVFGGFSSKNLQKILDMRVYLPEKTLSLVERVLAANQSDPSVNINHFRLVGVLGMGSSGIVFEAMDEKLNRKVAIKVMIYTTSNSKMQNSLFYHEAKAIAAVKHESLVDIYEIGEWNDLQFIVMPFLAGENLATRLKHNERKPFMPAQAIPIAIQIAQGLKALHEIRILHRDLKPSNIWLTNEKSGRDKIIILDLGLAHRLDTPINDGLYCGTQGYMSPEQTNGDTLDVRSDLFTFGCVLFEMLNGKPPFSFASRVDAITFFRKGLTPDLRLFQEKIPGPLGSLVRSLMEVNRENRPATIAEVIKQLKTIEKKLSSPPYSRRQVILTVLSGSLLFSAGLFLLYKQVYASVF